MDVILRFEVQPHGPLRVSTGQAGDGADATVNLDQPVPATSLKGLARHCALDVLELPASLVNSVFGSPSTPAPWAWSDLEIDPLALRVLERAQVSIDPETGTAAHGKLMFNQEIWFDPARPAPTFDVSLMRHLSLDETRQHCIALIGAVCGIHSIGASRRRGLGWVTIRLSRQSSLPSSLALGPDSMSDIARELVTMAGAE